MKKRVFKVWADDIPIDWGYEGSEYLSWNCKTTRNKEDKNQIRYRITVEEIKKARVK